MDNLTRMLDAVPDLDPERRVIIERMIRNCGWPRIIWLVNTWGEYANVTGDVHLEDGEGQQAWLEAHRDEAPDYEPLE